MRLKMVLFLAIFGLAAYFRFVGLNWDANQHLHPDERFLTMVAQAMRWPNNLAEYFDTNKSTLNPHNLGYNFYVYGTFPVILVKAVADILHLGDYNQLTIVGRAMSAIFDLGTMILVFLIAKLIVSREVPPLRRDDPAFPALLAMFFYAIANLPIQLSHFFAVDPYLTFFLTASIYLVLKQKFGILLGVTLALAVASKISALLISPVIFLSFLWHWKTSKSKLLVTMLGFVFTLLLSYPYLFTWHGLIPQLNPQILANWQELKAFDGVDTMFPPALQWIPTKPIIYPFLHNFLWGLGIPLGIVVVIAVLYLVFHFSFNYELILLSSWVVLLFTYQGLQFSKALRYFYPIYPALAVLAGIFTAKVITKFRNNVFVFIIYHLSFIIVFLYIFAFTSIYRHPHSRVTASVWIYENIPARATIANEIWDDSLPLPIGVNNSNRYRSLNFPLYDPDTPVKWHKLSDQLSQTDYIFLTSNRLWRSLSAIPERFPQTANYYQKLFSEELGFRQVAVFTSYPCLFPKINGPDNTITNLKPSPFSLTTTNYCQLALNDDGAEESFTVYDHPKVIILENYKQLTPTQIYNLIYER